VAGTRNTALWIVWLALTLAAGGSFGALIFVGGPRNFLLIGKTTGAHHQFELACETCHTSGFFEDAAKIDKAMNKACLACHEDELKVSNDSHPVKKFRDPRNADRRQQLDALFCTTCHMEHVPEITRPVAVTLPMDYCSACHKAVGEERPSHAGLAFNTCAAAGCHNFHDNTALYEDFLAKNVDMADIIERPIVRLAAISRAPHPVLAARENHDPVAALRAYLMDTRRDAPEFETDAVEMLARVLEAGDAVAPAEFLTRDTVAAWAGSGHALGGVNCAGCHTLEHAKERDTAILAANWIAEPGIEICRSCHKEEARTFVLGRHGMRLHPEISEPRQAPKNALLKIVAAVFRDEALWPISVADARLEMKPEAAHLEIGNCNTCHKPHDADIRAAAVDACAGCHNDPHTRTYFSSPHYQLWQTELAGGAPGSGVSCADCHMPKLEARGHFFTTHNQNAYLRPNEKMIRPVCMHCHGLAFAMDALADPALVENNFNGRPSRHVESIDWAVKRARKTE